MSAELKTYKIKDWIVLGKTSFSPPRKISDSLVNEARIVHVNQGNSLLYSANQQVSLTNNDTLIMKTDNFINNWSAHPNNENTTVLVFQLTSDLLHFLYNNNLPEWFSTSSKTNKESILKLNQHNLLHAYFTSLEHYINNENYFSEEIITSKVKELIALMVSLDHSGETRNIFGNLFKASEYEFKETIASNLFEDLNIEDFAFLTGMSVSSFKRKFSEVYGTSPNKYIVTKRLDQAQTLLSTSTLSISEIAYDCGFSDVGYFSKSFKKYYNMSPSDFKNQV